MRWRCGASSVRGGKRYRHTGKSRSNCCSVKPPRSIVSSIDSLRMRTNLSRRLTATIFRQEPVLLGREWLVRALLLEDPLLRAELSLSLTSKRALDPKVWNLHGTCAAGQSYPAGLSGLPGYSERGGLFGRGTPIGRVHRGHLL